MRNPLPESLDPEYLAADGESLSGIWPASRCERLAASVHRVSSDVALKLVVTEALPGQFDMKGHISVELEFLCQRCLQAMSWSLDASFQLSAVDASLAEKMVAETDIYELDEQGQIATGQWLEDEILLKLPLVLSHEELTECDANMLSRSKEYIDTEDSQPNPFAVLKKLKE